MTEARELYNTVIKGNYCIGCGSCASIVNSPFKIKTDEFGNIVAYPIDNLDISDVSVLHICPFSGKSKNEDEISDIFFNNVYAKDTRIGRYLKCFAGHVEKGKFRDFGSSGGIGKWIGYTLLSESKIDYFIHVIPNKTKDATQPLFDYEIISEKDEVLKGSKSSYYPVSLIKILDKLKNTDGRFAITGVPCFIKTLRSLSLEDKDLKSKIKYTIGIICGGMKSANQAKIIGWQLGIKPENLVAIDFRRKHIDKPASFKIYQAWSNVDEKERYKDSYDIFGTDWSGYFRPKACDFCDDVVSETADVSIGDAWLPKYVNDPKGTSIIIIRNSEILDLIERNNAKGELKLDEVSPDDVAKSQAGGLRHRREALSYRIEKKEANNLWYPQKRVKAHDYKITRKRRRIYTLREKIARQSHISSYNALHKNDLNVFIKEMKPLQKKYYNAIYGNIAVRGFNKAKRIFLKVLKKNNL